MANESLGPVQIAEVTQYAINDALRQLVERIDEVKGLHGDLSIFGELTLAGVALRLTDSNGHLVHALGATT